MKECSAENNLLIYVIIVTWNGMKWIDQCLSALRKSTYPVNTIVIDNGSTDNTVNHIKDNYQDVDLHIMNHNLGFGQANNFGIKIALKAGCDYVYLLNQDAYVFPDMFSELLQAHKESDGDSIGILSPLHVHDSSRLDLHFKLYIKNIYSDWIEDILFGKPKPYYLTDGVPAAGWLIPRKTIETIGGFDPIFFHYDEDNQYIQRLTYHGLRTAVVPTAKMIHDREDFGNSKLALRDQIFRSLKGYYFLNINYGFWELFGKISKIAIVHSAFALRALFKLEAKKAAEYPIAMIRNLCNIPIYYRDRKINRKIGATWLN